MLGAAANATAISKPLPIPKRCYWSHRGVQEEQPKPLPVTNAVEVITSIQRRRLASDSDIRAVLPVIGVALA
jgi:hypothetical protein